MIEGIIQAASVGAPGLAVLVGQLKEIQDMSLLLRGEHVDV